MSEIRKGMTKISGSRFQPMAGIETQAPYAGNDCGKGNQNGGHEGAIGNKQQHRDQQAGAEHDPVHRVDMVRDDTKMHRVAND